MRRSRLLVALAVALALVPAGLALADSAGDNQYQDPFGNTAPQNTTPQPTTTPAPTSQTQPSTTSQPSTSQSSNSAAASSTSSSGQLPRTGLDLRIVGGLGGLLVAGGLLLRRRLA